MASIEELAPVGDGSDGRATKDSKLGDYLGTAAQVQEAGFHGASRYAKDPSTLQVATRVCSHCNE
eukprot:1360711-Lingulodinium_polyedra.AAC.1